MLRSIRRGYEGLRGLSFLREDKDYVISIRRNIGQIRTNEKRKRIKRAFHIAKKEERMRPHDDVIDVHGGRLFFFYRPVTTLHSTPKIFSGRWRD
ncbi:Uncharacterized protein APZ42_027576 [Daphnia magna]|uniref:Uncharacterized protein n=1 Tax=Daphnia magna TaxID=35525 RepID=A0A164R919_9CRUS|nr:Uncharacterized protein APZ42_027576 [Daphnia magna]